MYKHPLFISWVLLLVIIATLHIIALEFYLYWVYSWFDIMMHFLGGLFVGLSTLWFFFQSGYIKLTQSLKNIIFTTIGSIIFIGVGWEIFELFAGILIEENFVVDTIIDISVGWVGAFVAGSIFIKFYIKNNL